MIVHNERAEPWRVTLVDTGTDSMTGGRLLRVKNHLDNEKAFMFTYGDGVGDINISELIKFHKKTWQNCNINNYIPITEDLEQLKHIIIKLKILKKNQKEMVQKLTEVFLFLINNVFDYTKR